MLLSWPRPSVCLRRLRTKAGRSVCPRRLSLVREVVQNLHLRPQGPKEGHGEGTLQTGRVYLGDVVCKPSRMRQKRLASACPVQRPNVRRVEARKSKSTRWNKALLVLVPQTEGNGPTLCSIALEWHGMGLRVEASARAREKINNGNLRNTGSGG